MLWQAPALLCAPPAMHVNMMVSADIQHFQKPQAVAMGAACGRGRALAPLLPFTGEQPEASHFKLKVTPSLRAAAGGFCDTFWVKVLALCCPCSSTPRECRHPSHLCCLGGGHGCPLGLDEVSLPLAKVVVWALLLAGQAASTK